MFTNAVTINNQLCVQWAIDHSFPWDTKTVTSACKYANMNVVTYLSAKGAVFNETHVQSAIDHFHATNDIKLLEYLMTNKHTCKPGQLAEYVRIKRGVESLSKHHE
jgi:hypothetical protein